MRKPRRRFAVLLVTGLAAFHPNLPRRSLALDDVDRLLWRARAHFVPTSDGEREALARLVPLLLAGARAATPPDAALWQADAERAGFRIEDWQLGGQSYWALVEPPGRRRGAGAYLFRVAPAAGDAEEVLLEAPHELFDVGSGRLAAQLFFQPPPGAAPRAFFSNTIHRYMTESGEKVRGPGAPADVAHNAAHGYTTATAAFAGALPRVRVIQLHGFAGAADEETGEGAVPPGTTMVVSAGDKGGSSPLSTAIARALARAFGDGVRRYPEDSPALGATTNAQRRALAAFPGARFIHVELSPETRKALLADADARARFAAILFGTESP